MKKLFFYAMAIAMMFGVASVAVGAQTQTKEAPKKEAKCEKKEVKKETKKAEAKKAEESKAAAPANPEKK